MMFNRLAVLNIFSAKQNFQLMMGLLGHNPILSQGRSVPSIGVYSFNILILCGCTIHSIAWMDG